MKISVKIKCRLFNFCNCFLLTYNIICHIIYKSIYYTAYNIVEDTGLGKGWERMIFNTGSALLDAIVLAVVSREPEGTYGYKITQEVRQAIDLSESTLYPVLRRLQKDGCLEVYDMEFGGRNRRYYRITEQGSAQLSLYESEWIRYSEKITALFEGGQN